MAKIMICDKMDQSAIDEINARWGCDVMTGQSPEELATTIEPYEAVVIRSATKVRTPAIDAGKNLRVIIRGGVGIDNIDHEYARSKGIDVRNTPAASSDGVAELALGMMFSLARHIHKANVTMRKGEWNKKQYAGIELAGKTLGIIGIGRIGQSLAKKAHALGMKVIAWDKFVEKSPLDIVTMVSKDDLLAQSDFVSLHIPKADGYVIGAEELAKMKPTAYLVNAARGGVVDEQALLDALNAGTIAGAGIDVWAIEPTDNHELASHENVCCLPHLGASSKESQERVGAEVIEILAEYFG
ncbi:MAG TPA: 3-phosphoglycerate dehydrogenase [candidate division Zixibacteria bacterium]|nr:3-phosphoglycerate dehydrogenase [candidate division Zixibacteria bacterium]